MNDSISRQAAIDAFLTELTKRERKNFLHTWSTVEVKYFVADMLEKLSSAQPGWIPCSESPMKNNSYLVWMPFAPEGHHITVAEWCGSYWNIKTPITAWMPLPEPWEEEKAEGAATP